MQKPNKSIEVIQDEDPVGVTDWIRDVGAGLGFCNRVFKEKLEVRMTEEMKGELERICKCEGGKTLGELTRQLYLEKIARFNMREKMHKVGYTEKSLHERAMENDFVRKHVNAAKKKRGEI